MSVGAIKDTRKLIGGEACRLLAEDCLSGPKCTQGPFSMQTMGECKVDGINLGIVDEGLVVEVDLIRMVCLGERCDMCLVTTAYRNEMRAGLMC